MSLVPEGTCPACMRTDPCRNCAYLDRFTWEMRIQALKHHVDKEYPDNRHEDDQYDSMRNGDAVRSPRRYGNG